MYANTYYLFVFVRSLRSIHKLNDLFYQYPMCLWIDLVIFLFLVLRNRPSGLVDIIKTIDDLKLKKHKITEPHLHTCCRKIVSPSICSFMIRCLTLHSYCFFYSRCCYLYQFTTLTIESSINIFRWIYFCEFFVNNNRSNTNENEK